MKAARRVSASKWDIHKRKMEENVGLLLNGVGDPVMRVKKKTEVLFLLHLCLYWQGLFGGFFKRSR